MSLPHVSSEGDPIILGDFEALHKWSGDFESYGAACELLERGDPSPLSFAGAESVVWDFGGPGTGDIIVPSESHISVDFQRNYPIPATSAPIPCPIANPCKQLPIASRQPPFESFPTGGPKLFQGHRGEFQISLLSNP